MSFKQHQLFYAILFTAAQCVALNISFVPKMLLNQQYCLNISKSSGANIMIMLLTDSKNISIDVSDSTDVNGKSFDVFINENTNEKDHSLIGTLSVYPADKMCSFVEWNMSVPNIHPQDCVHLQAENTKNDTWWYGGAEQFESYFATKDGYGNNFKMQPFISSDIYLSKHNLGGVLEASWFNSEGWSVQVMKEDPVPLWASLKDKNSCNVSSLCLRGDWRDFEIRTVAAMKGNYLKYRICGDSNVKSSWENRILKQSDYSKKSPEVSTILNPIYSTWAEYKRNVNESDVREFANRIVARNYPRSVLEIDDKWSSSYGEFEFNKRKFPNAHKMIQELKSQEFAVMLWITPFCDLNAEVFQEGVEKRYWVMRKSNSTEPYLKKWWENNGTGSAVLDVTNPFARKWFVSRLKKMQLDYEVDGFKFDAGETYYIPSLSEDADYYDESVFHDKSQPLKYTQLYANLAKDIKGNIVEYRSSWKNQGNFNYVRIMDLDSVWGQKNGIGSVLPRVLHFSSLGYRYALPDMVGGNGYGPRGDLLFRGLPEAELYIRWFQLQLLLPTQISITPWRYEKDKMYDDINKIVEDIFSLRSKLIKYLKEAISQATTDGLPIIRPMWYAAPSDPRSYAIDNQYLIGDKVLIAPILKPRSTSRDVYLPSGTWKSCSFLLNQSEESLSWKGPRILRRRNISLSVLPPCFILA